MQEVSCRGAAHPRPPGSLGLAVLLTRTLEGHGHFGEDPCTLLEPLQPNCPGLPMEKPLTMWREGLAGQAPGADGSAPSENRAHPALLLALSPAVCPVLGAALLPKLTLGLPLCPLQPLLSSQQRGRALGAARPGFEFDLGHLPAV